MRDKKVMYMGGTEGGEELGIVQEEEIIIRDIIYVRNLCLPGYCHLTGVSIVFFF